MVQVRIMHTTHAAAVSEVMNILLPWLQQCPDLVVGHPQELGTRGGTGSRIVFELLPTAEQQRPIRATAEVIDRTPARRRTAPRRALPPSRRQIE
ncbi:hypothetical protein ACFYY8_31765 [Streptosporangium sp. NPDC001559]|uniref:hypothetical protein n=1 Tax=Streptosporangium sp. NPDC001559 TaxID=3366187 RepID=UPI0036EF1F6F